MRAPDSSLFSVSFRIGGLLALTLAVACTRDAPSPVMEAPPPGAAPETRAPDSQSAPFDVGAIIRQVHFAWRPDSGAWSGGHSTYTVRSSAEGLSLTPYHSLRKTDVTPAPGGSKKEAKASAAALAGAPLTLGTPALKRGERRLGAVPTQGRVEQDGHLALVRGDVTEHLRNAEDGVEQSWSFEHAPSGRGDLLVEIPVKGLTYAGVTATGLHFTDARTGLGFRYGHGTWVDGRGQRTPVEARFAQGRIQLRVPAGLLDDSAYPAVLDPSISPESGLDAPVTAPQTGDQTAAKVGALGSAWLVCWYDFAGASQVNCTRVSSAGQVLDVNGIGIPAASQFEPISDLSIAAGASEWLLVWEKSTRDIYGARVSAGGQVLDPAGIPIAETTTYKYEPSVTSSGSGYFVVYRESNGATSVVYGVRLSSTGQPVGSPVRLSPSTGWALSADVAFNGTSYLVVWQEYTSAQTYDIRGARVSSTGTLQDATPRTLCAMDGNQWHPAVAANGSSWLVVWEDQRSGAAGGADIYGTAVWSDGTVATPNGNGFMVANGSQTYPDVAARGAGWFVVWEDSQAGYPDIYGKGTFSDGTPSNSAAVAVSAQARAEYYPSVASGGGDLLVVWHEAHSGGDDIHGARVTTQDVVRDTTSLLLNSTLNDQYAPSVARAGTDFLVVWRDNRAGESDIYGARVTSQGAVLDPSGLELCTASGEQDNPVVASNGTDWMVAWDDNRLDATYEDLYGLRVSRTGALLSPWAITLLSSAMRNPALASDGADWYVAWEDGRDSLGSTSWNIYGARVTVAGSVVPTTGTNLTEGNTGIQLAPAIAFNGTDYLVAWTDYRSNVTNSDDIYATRVSRTGTVRSPGGYVVNKAAGSQLAPAVASAGTDWLVAWQSAGDIYGTRVTFADTVLDPSGLAIATSATTQSRPTVASDGTNYFVAWEERTTSTNQDIYGARVSGTTGALLDAPFAIAASPENELLPSAASRAPSEFLLLYQRADPATAALAERIRARTVTFNHAPVASSAAVTTAEDTPAPITLTATDADGDALTFTIVKAPSLGALSGTPPALTYTPFTNLNGADSFTWRATDSSGESSPVVTVSVTVTPVNDPPTGVPITIQMNEDSVLNLPPLQGFDPEGEAVTFSVQTLPTHGTLTGTPASLRYAPAPNFYGSDSFSFIVTDASGTASAPITVPITVSAMNDFPEPYAQSASLDQDTYVDLVLEAFDVDGDALTFSIDRPPRHGTLSGTAPNVRYTPAAGYRGPDDFLFRVRDGKVVSESATVSLTVRPVNVAPVAHGQSATLVEDTPRTLTLSGSDVDGDELTYSLATGPAHGVLSGTLPEVTYTPTANFHGGDSFTFIVRDTSGVVSAPATVALTVTADNDVPVAQAQSVQTEEDGVVVLTLAGSDVEGDALTFTVTTLPEHGALSGTPPEVTYTPHGDFEGEDGFTFQVTDAAGASSEPVRVSVTVTPVNDAPVAQAKTVQVDEDGWTDFAIEGQDVDGDAVDFTVRTQPLHGVLTGTPPDLRYTPAGDFHGEDRFTFTVSDASGSESAPATVSITVAPVNDAPVALAQSASVDEDSDVSLMLRGSDVDGDTLTFTITTQPLHGTLSGTPPSVTYTPAADFHGADSFRFEVEDGREHSAAVTVSLTVNAVNDAPVATPLAAIVDEDAALTLTLAGTDPEGDTLTYTVTASPSHGTLSGAPPELTYTPAPDFHGTDSFSFTVTDSSGATSLPATVRITVNPVNDLPMALAASVELDEDTPRAITLAGSDVEGSPLAFVITEPPAHGTLSGTPPNVTYTPAADFHGTDGFAFAIKDDEGATSPSATISITIAPVNDTPVAMAASVELNEDTTRALSLAGSDVEGGALTFVIAESPTHGTLSGTPPEVTYTPAANFHGIDSFTFVVRDNEGATSLPAMVSLTVAPVNDAPVALAESVELNEDTPRTLTLEGSDEEGGPLTFAIRESPAHGTLSGSAPDVTYTPATDFHGTDSFTFSVTDASGTTSTPATVSLTVAPVNDAPVALAASVELDEDTSRPISLAGFDVEGSPLTFVISESPAHGTLSGTPPELTYTPTPDFHGTDSFTFTVTDASGATSLPATVSLAVLPTSDAPVAMAQSRETDEDTSVPLTLTGTDADAQALTFAVEARPEHGTLTGTPPEVTYLPAPDFHGTDSFTFTVSDGASTSTATVSLTVHPVNDVPLALDQVLQLEPEPTALTLAGTDVDGDALTFAIHTPPEHGTLSGTPPELTFTPAEGFRGTTTFAFTASDGLATSAPATVTLRVGNSVPVVAVALQTQRPFEGEALLFQTTAADANGDSLTFTWDFGDGASSEEASPIHAYTNEGTYEAVLTVTDGIDTVRHALVLDVRNAAPVLVPVEAPAQAEEGQELTFHARASDSGERDTLTFAWDFGDGSAPAAGPEATHTYADNGPYTVKVTVTDDAGAFAQEVREVQVANLPPVPVPVPAQTLRGGEALSLQLKATDVAGERDPLTWSLVEGPGAVTPEGLYTWTTEARTGGHFPVRVRVTDDEDGSAELVLDITVRKQLPAIPAPDSGCGCASGQGGAASSAALLFVVALLLSRRRRA